MKIIWLIWGVFVIVGFFPYKHKLIITGNPLNELIITGQACGCPCPEASVVRGKLNIPENIREKYPNIHETEINLEGNSPYSPFNNDIFLSEILIEGQVIGADVILCTPDECEMAPRFRVTNWYIASYIPYFIFWNKKIIYGYLGIILAGLISLTIKLIFKQKNKLRHINNT